MAEPIPDSTLPWWNYFLDLYPWIETATSEDMSNYISRGGLWTMDGFALFYRGKKKNIILHIYFYSTDSQKPNFSEDSMLLAGSEIQEKNIPNQTIENSDFLQCPEFVFHSTQNFTP